MPEGEVFSGDQHLLECYRWLFCFTGPSADPSGPLVAIYNRRSMDQSSGSNASEGDRASHPTESSHLNPPTPACCLLCLFDVFRDQRFAVYTVTRVRLKSAQRESLCQHKECPQMVAKLNQSSCHVIKIHSIIPRSRQPTSCNQASPIASRRRNQLVNYD